MLYLMIGLVLVVFAKEFSFDIVGIYFGVPFAVTAFGGMLFLSVFREDPVPENARHLRKLRNVAASLGVVGIIFKVLDAFFCSAEMVWVFPHPIFHLLTTYATHCFVVFMAFYRANNSLVEGDPFPALYWYFGVYPLIFTPDVPELDDRRLQSVDQPDIFLERQKKKSAASKGRADTTLTTGTELSSSMPKPTDPL
jgi:hypothetical protein